MLNLFISLIFSSVYWTLDHFPFYLILDKSNGIYIIEKLFFKYLSIILLFNYIPFYDFRIPILLLYSFGDLAIVYNEILTIYLFSCAHLLLLYQFITLYKFIILLLISPILYISTLYFYEIISFHSLHRLLYIGILHTLFVITILNGYYGAILLILSDISIGINYHYTKLFEWPLYYCSVLYLVYLV